MQEVLRAVTVIFWPRWLPVKVPVEVLADFGHRCFTQTRNHQIELPGLHVISTIVSSSGGAAVVVAQNLRQIKVLRILPGCITALIDYTVTEDFR